LPHDSHGGGGDVKGGGEDEAGACRIDKFEFDDEGDGVNACEGERGGFGAVLVVAVNNDDDGGDGDGGGGDGGGGDCADALVVAGRAD